MRKKGFTYIELMIAISIFTLLILMVMKLNSTSESNLNKQIYDQKMMFLAQHQMEKFKTTLANIGTYPNDFKLDDSGYYIVVSGNNYVTNNSNVYLATVWIRKSPLDNSNEIKLQSHVLMK